MELVGTVPDATVLLQLTLAMALGLILGAERSIAGKHAGMRTYALVSLGACMFVIISSHISGVNFNDFNIDPLRVAAGIVTGVGFLGAGLIILRESHLQGLTTAAGLWVAAGIGVGVGYQMYILAVYVTFLTLIVFTLMWFIEERLKRIPNPRNKLHDEHVAGNDQQ